MIHMIHMINLAYELLVDLYLMYVIDHRKRGWDWKLVTENRHERTKSHTSKTTENEYSQCSKTLCRDQPMAAANMTEVC